MSTDVEHARLHGSAAYDREQRRRQVDDEFDNAPGGQKWADKLWDEAVGSAAAPIQTQTIYVYDFWEWQALAHEHGCHVALYSSQERAGQYRAYFDKMEIGHFNRTIEPEGGKGRLNIALWEKIKERLFGR
jgi:hypothetical protein